jgi:hypothetical protein
MTWSITENWVSSLNSAFCPWEALQVVYLSGGEDNEMTSHFLSISKAWCPGVSMKPGL